MSSANAFRNRAQAPAMAVDRGEWAAHERRRRRRRAAVALVLLALGLSLALAGALPTARGAAILVKAQVAQWLIERAWQDNRTHAGQASRPWPWADLTPVARLGFERQGEHRVVMDNDRPRTLAFGPGLRAGTPLPGTGGNSVISAHRDTHFALLGDVRDGDPIVVQTLDGETVHYRVAGRRIVDVNDGWVADDHGRDELTLVTCWPLDALRAGGRQRLVVTAVRLDPPRSRHFLYPLPGSTEDRVD
jgi:sortase A